MAKDPFLLLGCGWVTPVTSWAGKGMGMGNGGGGAVLKAWDSHLGLEELQPHSVEL